MTKKMKPKTQPAQKIQNAAPPPENAVQFPNPRKQKRLLLLKKTRDAVVVAETAIMIAITVATIATMTVVTMMTVAIMMNIAAITIVTIATTIVTIVITIVIIVVTDAIIVVVVTNDPHVVHHTDQSLVDSVVDAGLSTLQIIHLLYMMEPLEPLEPLVVTATPVVVAVLV